MDNKTDVRFAAGIRYRCNDALSGELDKLTRIQLYDTRAWAKFVNLFKHPGVDDHDRGWRGEYWGKMMRGACFTYAVTGDDHLYSVIEETCRDMLTAQDELGRFSTYSVEKEFDGWDIWSRKYIMLGFLYFLEICRDGELADVIQAALCRHADYILEKFGREEEGKLVLPARTNSWDGLNNCSILEPFVFLYSRTKEPRYLKFAEYIRSFGGTLHQNLFELAYENKLPVYQYHVTKAYEMISCFEGLAEYSKIMDDARARETVIRFADNVLANESTIIGCLGCQYESFDHAAAEQFNEAHGGIMQETCVTVTWMKFMWQLYRMTGDARYMDEFEISMYNAMSASLRRHIDPEANGGIPLPIHSYNPLRHAPRFKEIGGYKNIDDTSFYGCCVCISSAGFALEATASAALDREGNLYVNLYRNGTISADGIELAITTGYPYAADSTIHVKVTKYDRPCGLYFRIPKWSKTAALRSGNLTIPSTVKDGSYLALNTPDGGLPGLEFDLVLDMTPYAVHPSDCVPDTAVDHYIAVRRGPLTYALDETADAEPIVPLTDEAIQSAAYTTDAPVECRAALKLTTASGPVTLVDYASAGQEPDHNVCAWIRVKESK
ncbi:MAG: beta-L-arabinofuranosidase domain-containing protein [Eubacteriales bacterium]